MNSSRVRDDNAYFNRDVTRKAFDGRLRYHRHVLCCSSRIILKTKKKSDYRSVVLARCDFRTVLFFDRVGSYPLKVVVVVAYESGVKEITRDKHSDCSDVRGRTGPGGKKTNKKQIIVRRKRVRFIL